MKKLFALILATATALFAQPTLPINNARFSGTSLINSGAFLYAASGGTVGVQSGGTFAFANGGLFAGDAAAFRAAIGAGSGTGTVTSFSAGALSPLFTTSVATATSTPALTFTLSTQTANAVFAGPTTGSAATPTFRALVAADLPGGSLVTSIAGTANQIAASASTGAVTLSIPNVFTAPGTLGAVGHTIFEGVTSTGATGTGNLVYSITPTLTGSPVVGGVTFTSGAATALNSITSASSTNLTLTASSGVTAFGSATNSAYRTSQSFPLSALPSFVVEGRGQLIYDDKTSTPSGTPQAYFGTATRGGTGQSGYAGFFMVDTDAFTVNALPPSWEMHMEGADGKLYIVQLNSTGALTGKNLKVNTSGDLSLSSSTSGSSTSSAAIVANSVGLSENLWVGGTEHVAGILSATSNTASTSTTTGAAVITGGVGVSAQLNVADNIVSGTSTSFIVGGGFKAMRSGARSALQLDTYDSTAVGGSYFAGQRARGTSGSPSAVGDGDQLLAFLGRGWAATTNDFSGTVASIRAEAAESFTSTAQGARLVFLTTPVGSTSSALAESLRLTGGATPIWTGGAGNLTIVAGTGNSRSLTLQTTTSGSTATNAFVLDSNQNGTLTGNLTFGTSGSVLNGTTGSVGLTATGTNQSITVTPSGTGSVVVPALVNVQPTNSFNLPWTPTAFFGRRADAGRSSVGMGYDLNHLWTLDVPSAGQLQFVYYNGSGFVPWMQLTSSAFQLWNGAGATGGLYYDQTNLQLIVGDQALSGTGGFLGGLASRSEGVNSSVRSQDFNSSLTARSYFTGDRADGTFGSPTNTKSGMAIVSFMGNPYDGTTYNHGPEMRYTATQNYTGSAHGAKIEFYTVPDGSTTQTLAATFDQAQNAQFAGTIKSSGFARVTGDVTNATATMSNLTNLSVTVAAGVHYVGTIQLFAVDSTNTDGLAFDLGGGSCTFTDLEFGFAAQPAGSTLGTVTSTTSTTAVTLTIVSTSDAVYTISFGFTCNAGGTFIPRFAQASHSTGTATARKNSGIILTASTN